MRRQVAKDDRQPHRRSRAVARTPQRANHVWWVILALISLASTLTSQRLWATSRCQQGVIEALSTRRSINAEQSRVSVRSLLGEGELTLTRCSWRGEATLSWRHHIEPDGSHVVTPLNALELYAAPNKMSTDNGWEVKWRPIKSRGAAWRPVDSLFKALHSHRSP